MLHKAIFETDYGTVEFDSVEHCTINGEDLMFRFWHEDSDGHTVFYMQIISSNSKEKYATKQIKSIRCFALIREEIKSQKRPLKRNQED